MSNRKSELWQQLKEAGFSPEKPFVNWTVPELEAELSFAVNAGVIAPVEGGGPSEDAVPTAPPVAGVVLTPAEYEELLRKANSAPLPPAAPSFVELDLSQPDQIAGLRISTHGRDDPIRTDENGVIWYQDEIRKSATAKPRARRVVKYTDPGTETVTVQSDDYVETVEVPGQGARAAEARVTLPAYQTGIFKDPKFPFRVHIYNEMQGFDFDDVNDFYGGRQLVPAEILRTYVSTDLCYDIRTTIRAIEAEYRERVIKKEATV